MHSPPALTILALAVSVNLKAHTVKAGTSNNLESSVTAATITAVLVSLPLMYLANLDREIGALLIFDILILLAIVAANLESARLAMKLYKQICFVRHQ